MNKVNEWLFSGSTWTFTVAGIIANFETIKSLVLFFLGFIFLILQIIHQIQKILGKRP
jgi:hypothetical protein